MTPSIHMPLSEVPTLDQTKHFLIKKTINPGAITQTELNLTVVFASKKQFPSVWWPRGYGYHSQTLTKGWYLSNCNTKHFQTICSRKTKFNEWKMHLYSALLCIAVHPKCFKITWGVGSLLNHHQCAVFTWMMRRLPQDNGASALTTHQLQVERRESHRANQVYALTTHQLQVERRECHRANQVYALTTHQLQVERRECHRANQVDGDY